MLARVAAFALAVQIQGGPTPPPRPTPASIGRAVDVVFRDPELQQGLQGRSLFEVLRAALDALWLYVDDAMRWLLSLEAASPTLYWLLFAVMLVVLVLLVWHIVYTMRMAFRPVAETALAGVAGEVSERERHSAELRREARRLADAGDLREAARLLLLSLLALLEEHRILHVARSWTNREILDRLAAKTPGASDLRAFGTALERARYGGASLRRDEFDGLEQVLQTVGPGQLAEGSQAEDSR